MLKLSAAELWTKALKTKNSDIIKFILNATGYIPEDLTSKIIVTEKGEEVSKSIIEILLTGNRLDKNTVSFDTADKLLKAGATLPQPHRMRIEYELKSKYLKHLAGDDHDLYIALRTNPDIIKEQDETGQTILHHAASCDFELLNNAGLILHLLFKSATPADFTTKDNQGNTPVHVAAVHCNNKVTCQYIFPNYARKAAELGFDFSTLNEDGHAVIHLATTSVYEDEETGISNTVARLLKVVPKIDPNVSTSSGGTAFYYAINRGYLHEANTLLDAGADPMLGSEDRDPLTMINHHIDTQKRFIALLEANKEGKKEKISEFVKDDTNRATLVKLAQEENYSELNDPNLEKFASKLASRYSLETLQTNFLASEEIKQRMLQPAKREQKGDKLPFWMEMRRSLESEEKKEMTATQVDTQGNRPPSPGPG